MTAQNLLSYSPNKKAWNLDFISVFEAFGARCDQNSDQTLKLTIYCLAQTMLSPSREQNSASTWVRVQQCRNDAGTNHRARRKQHSPYTTRLTHSFGLLLFNLNNPHALCALIVAAASNSLCWAHNNALIITLMVLCAIRTLVMELLLLYSMSTVHQVVFAIHLFGCGPCFCWR